MKNLFGHLALTLGLLFGLTATTNAESFDPNQQALAAFRATLEAHPLPAPRATQEGLREQAAYLMLIKNVMSLYRDGYLEQQDAQVVVELVQKHLEYVTTTQAQAQGWLGSNRQLLRTMHYHALSVSQLVRTPTDAPRFKGLMEAYHHGIGYDAYRAAQAAGIEQHWLDPDS